MRWILELISTCLHLHDRMLAFEISSLHTNPFFNLPSCELGTKHFRVATPKLDKPQSPCGKEHHSSQDQAVFPSVNIGFAVESLLVANRDIDDFKVLFIS